MFWSKKKKQQEPVKLDREALKAEALANARKAREQIGPENLERLGRLLGEQMKSEGLKAREKIRSMDHGHVADNLKIILKDE
jgi:hypothetical protein